MKDEYSTQNNTVENSEVIEKLKKEHPLVTDIKCFNINWWPEAIPSVLQEYEE